jgi:hypothetical protein
VARDKPVSQFNPTGVALELGPAVCRSRERLVNVAVYPVRDSLEVGVNVGSGRSGVGVDPSDTPRSRQTLRGAHPRTTHYTRHVSLVIAIGRSLENRTGTGV